MSALRVAIVCEGRTDYFVLEQVVLSVFGPCVVDPLQPMRDALDPTVWPGQHGWTGVKAWCENLLSEGIADEMTIGGIDVLVIHIDGDMCGRDGLPATRTDLCDHIKQHWIGPPGVPHGVVICIPAMATDTWLAAAIDPALVVATFEADADPVGHLNRTGVKKNQYEYRAAAPQVLAAVPALRAALSELDRFVGKLEVLVPA